MWQPIETAPKDQFLLLCGPSGYTTTPMVVTTGCMCSDYHVGRWIDHANDDLTDWGFEPTHWAPLILPSAQPAPIEQDTSVRKAWARFSNELHRGPHAPYPGMSEAFEQHFSQSFTDREWRAESATWAAAWKAAKNHGAQAQPAPSMSSVPEGWQDGVEDVAAMLQEKADDYAEEYGYDDMGGLSFGGGMGGEVKMDYYNNLIELIEEVRAMLAATPEAKPCP